MCSLVFLFAVSSVVSGWVRESRLNVLDRSLGFVAGIAVATAIVSALYIPVSASWADLEEQPGWFREARLRPVIQWSAGIMRAILPERLGGNGGDINDSANRAADEAERAFKTLVDPRPRAEGADEAAGYNAGERREMDRLFESARER